MKSEQDDKLDHLLRSKLTRKDFVLKDEYWQNARRMVDESRPQHPKPRMYATFLISGIMLVLVSVAAINYSISTKHTTEASGPTEEDMLVPGDQAADESITAVAAINTSDNAQPVLAMHQEEEAQAVHVKKGAPHTDAIVSKQPVRVNERENATAAIAPAETTPNKPGRTNRIRAAAITETPEATGINASVNKTTSLTHHAKADRVTTSSSETLVAAGYSGEDKLPGKNTTLQNVNTAFAGEPANSITGDAINSPAEITEVSAAESASSASQDATAVVRNKPLYAAVIGMAGAGRATLGAPHAPVTQEISRKPLHRSHEFKLLEAGATCYNPSAGIWDNINFHMAAKYGFHVGRKTDLTIGVGYSRLHQSKGTRTYNVTSYDLGEQISTNGVNTVRLDYIDLPLSVYYAVHGRHGLTGGVAFSYLVRSADLLKKPDQTRYNIKANGYFGAFAPFDVQLNIGYTYMLSPRIMITGSYHQGVIDITKNNVFRSGSYNTNSGARLTIGYQLH